MVIHCHTHTVRASSAIGFQVQFTEAVRNLCVLKMRQCLQQTTWDTRASVRRSPQPLSLTTMVGVDFLTTTLQLSSSLTLSSWYVRAMVMKGSNMIDMLHGTSACHPITTRWMYIVCTQSVVSMGAVKRSTGVSSILGFMWQNTGIWWELVACCKRSWGTHKSRIF